MAQHVINKVISRLYGEKRGWVFTKNNFLDLGAAKTIAKALERLTDSGKIRRLARGLYDYPEKHPELGELPPNYEHIADALAGRDNLKIQPSGAANFFFPEFNDANAAWYSLIRCNSLTGSRFLRFVRKFSFIDLLTVC